MARVKLSEYRAKQLLTTDYQGVSLKLTSLTHDCEQLSPTVMYVVKVDQGIKKRGKQGLIRLNVAAKDVAAAATELSTKGFERFIAEPMLPHEQSDEQYVSFERQREGILVNYSSCGGIDIEDNADSIQSFYWQGNVPNNIPLQASFFVHIITVMDTQLLSFVEINPLVVIGDSINYLDAAVLADSAGEYAADWSEHDIVEATARTDEETAVNNLDRNSTAALTLRILNPNGALWLLLSGGGASITVADEAHNKGHADVIGNYGEYSGGPTGEEVYLYTSEVIKSLKKSNAPKKALIIAGGIANFTDVAVTFRGLIRALTDHLDTLQSEHIKVFVRRGGPNEPEGLALMADFLKQHDLYGSVHGSKDILTVVVDEALEYIYE